MTVRGLMLVALCKSQWPKFLFSSHIFLRPLFLHSYYQKTGLCNLICNVFWRGLVIRPHYRPQNCNIRGIHLGLFLSRLPISPESGTGGDITVADGGGGIVVADGLNQSKEMKAKRKKLKGRRAVVKWLKCFRWKKKKEFQKMTAEEKLLFNLRKARKKEERLLVALKKIEPKETSKPAPPAAISTSTAAPPAQTPSKPDAGKGKWVVGIYLSRSFPRSNSSSALFSPLKCSCVCPLRAAPLTQTQTLALDRMGADLSRKKEPKLFLLTAGALNRRSRWAWDKPNLSSPLIASSLPFCLALNADLRL